MSEIYEPRRIPHMPHWYEVVDTRTGARADNQSFPSWAGALQLAARMNTPPPQPAAPRCAGCERLQKALAEARHELAQLSRTTRDADTADSALAAIDRLRDMTRGQV